MKKAFAIVTVNATERDQQLLHGLFREGPWWHHTPQLWIVVDPTGRSSTSDIQVRMHAALPNLVFLVLELTVGAGVAGWTPTSWHEWLTSQLG